MKMYMKTIILTILFALLTMGVAGQNTDNLSEKSETEKVNEFLEKVLPQFPGGHEALMKFLKKNVTYPMKREYALLFVKEGACVILKMPKWNPGKIDGVEVRVNHSLVINFAIPNK